MSIIGTLQKYLSEYKPVNLVMTDMTRGTGSYALSQSASGAIKRDIMGGVTYQNSYIFLMEEHGKDEVDRKDNYDFLEGFCAWLEGRVETGDLPALATPYQAVSLEVSNIALMDIGEGGEAIYQAQIQFVYRKNNEVKNKWLM